MHENKIIALFFDFTKQQEIADQDLFKKIWNLGGTPIIFVFRKTTVDIYNGFSFNSEKSTFDQLKIEGPLINNDNINKYNDERPLYRAGKDKGEIFKAPYVLLKKGFDRKTFSIISAYSEKDFVFSDSITAIQGEKNKDQVLLKNITGILNSKFASYYFLLQGSSAGIEREQGHNEGDRFQIPAAINKQISQKVDKIQNLYLELDKKNFIVINLKVKLKNKRLHLMPLF